MSAEDRAWQAAVRALEALADGDAETAERAFAAGLSASRKELHQQRREATHE